MKSKKHLLALLLITISMLLLSGCMRTQTIKGNGEIVTKQRKVGEFSEIDLKGAYRIQYVYAKKPSLSITTDSNIEPYIITRVRDGAMEVFNKRGYSVSANNMPIIEVAGPRLTALSVDGSGVVIAKDLKQTTFSLTIRGAGRAELVGKVNDFTLDASGASKVNAIHLKADAVSIDISGAGTAFVYATDNLSVRISGNGYVEYYGSPKTMNQSIQGAGKIFEVPSGKHPNKNP